MPETTLTRITRLECPCGDAYEGPTRPGVPQFLRDHASHGVTLSCPSCGADVPAADRPPACHACGLAMDWTE